MHADTVSSRSLRIVAPWLGLGLFDAMQTVFVMHSEGMSHAWLRLFGVRLISWLPWAIATPFVLRLWRRLPLESPQRARSWFVHGAACATIGTACALWTTSLYVAFDPYASPAPEPFVASWIDRESSSLVSSVVLYAVILIVAASIESRARLAYVRTETARLNELLSHARLESLRRQIEPHFLFNTLAAVSGLIRDGRNDDAVATIARLGALFRRLLDDTAFQHVTLHDELEFSRAYLELQQMRFADRLRLRFDVPLAYERAQVPSFILQPLLENAVKHGIAKRAQGGAIAIVASHHDGTLDLCVRNDGPPLPTDWESTRVGIGLSNVRNRLNGLYGDASRLRVRDADEGVEALLSLPFVLVPAMHDG